MKRFIALLTLGLCLGVGSLVVPAEAAVSTPAVSPDTTDTAGNGFAMGVAPDWWDLCVANGYGPTVGGPVLSWNYPPRQPTIHLQNRCDGYSITNRMTIDNVNNAGACIQYSNLGHSATQLGHLYYGYWIWNQNPVIWVNTRSGCNDPGEIEHSACKGVGYILGLVYVAGSPESCMGTNNGWNRATNADSLDVNNIYQH